MTTEVLSVQARTAIDDTKRGYGLWRGEVLHPASPRVAAALASGEPITDTKGLGLRYVPVRGDKVIPHFRVHDPEKFSAALDRAFPAVHDAVVRLVAEDVRAGGFAALERWCASGCLPEPFEVWEVRVEMRCDGYRPDICVRHPEGGQIELEVINTHAPEKVRLDKAWGAGHIVLSLRIRDLVEALVFSEGRGLVPDDETLRGLLKGRRFALCGRESVPNEVHAVWRDLNMQAYAVVLGARLSESRRNFFRAVLPMLRAARYGYPRVAEFDTGVPAVLWRVFESEPVQFDAPLSEPDIFEHRCCALDQALNDAYRRSGLRDAAQHVDRFLRGLGEHTDRFVRLGVRLDDSFGALLEIDGRVTEAIARGMSHEFAVSQLAYKPPFFTNSDGAWL
jgi:hypothetical protein